MRFPTQSFFLLGNDGGVMCAVWQRWLGVGDSRFSRSSFSGMTRESDVFCLAVLAWCGGFPTQSFLLLGNDEGE